MDRFELQTAFLPPTARVIAFESREALSEPYEMRVFVTLPKSTQLEPRDGILTRATLVVHETADGVPERHHGIVAKCEVASAAEEVSVWILTLRPEMFQLELSAHSRVFTDATVKATMLKVFEESGHVLDVDFSFEAAEGPEEEHVSQYKESDHAFFHRWAERRGWYYFYEQGEKREKMRIVDRQGAHTKLRQSAIPYRPGSGDRSAGEHFQVIRVSKKLQPSAVRVLDYDYKRPTQRLSGKASVSANGHGDVVHYGARAFDSAAVNSTAQFRAEALACRERVITMAGNAHHVYAGSKITVSEHPRPDIDGDYLVLAVIRRGRDPMAAGQWGSLVPKFEGDTDVYAIEATCIPAALQYRSRELTKWPRVWGHENATVDGPSASQYAQIDSDGRYHVRFRYDEGRKEARSSTRVRMMQPHGGSLEGWHMPLRQGTEVVCAFLDGDPDRAVIIGVVPNMTHASLVKDANAPQNVYQTGSASYLTIDDTDGSQWVNIFSPAQQSGLFLGAGRGEGGRSLTSNAAPAVVPEGPGAVKLGPFSVDLRTDQGSGRVHSGGDMNIHSFGKYQQIVKGVANITHNATLDFDNEGDAQEDLHDTLWHHSVGPAKRDFCSIYDFDVTASATTDFSSCWSMQTNLKRTHRHRDGVCMTVTDDATETCLQPRKIVLNGGYDLDITGDLTRTISAGQELEYGSRTIKVGRDYTLNIPAGVRNVNVSPEKRTQNSCWIKINLGFARDNTGTKNEEMSFHIEAWLGAHIELCYIANQKKVLGLNLGAHGPSAEAVGVDYYISPIKVEAKVAHTDLKGADLDLALLRVFFGSYLIHPAGIRTV